MSIEAMKMALEKLEICWDSCDAIDALKAAIEEAEKQEPVEITITGKLGNIYSFTGDYSLRKGDKVYTTPPVRPAELERLCRIMGTFDLATGHAETMDEALDALEEELRDVLGHYREALKVQMEKHGEVATDALTYGIGMMSGEKRVDPADFYKGYAREAERQELVSKPLSAGWILGMWPDSGMPDQIIRFARAIEASHGIVEEKNHGR